MDEDDDERQGLRLDQDDATTTTPDPRALHGLNYRRQSAEPNTSSMPYRDRGESDPISASVSMPLTQSLLLEHQRLHHQRQQQHAFPPHTTLAHLPPHSQPDYSFHQSPAHTSASTSTHRQRTQLTQHPQRTKLDQQYNGHHQQLTLHSTPFVAHSSNHSDAAPFQHHNPLYSSDSFFAPDLRFHASTLPPPFHALPNTKRHTHPTDLLVGTAPHTPHTSAKYRQQQQQQQQFAHAARLQASFLHNHSHNNPHNQPTYEDLQLDATAPFAHGSSFRATKASTRAMDSFNRSSQQLYFAKQPRLSSKSDTAASDEANGSEEDTIVLTYRIKKREEQGLGITILSSESGYDGLCVKDVPEDSPASGFLCEGDILLKVDDLLLHRRGISDAKALHILKLRLTDSSQSVQLTVRRDIHNLEDDPDFTSPRGGRSRKANADTGAEEIEFADEVGEDGDDGRRDSTDLEHTSDPHHGTGADYLDMLIKPNLGHSASAALLQDAKPQSPLRNVVVPRVSQLTHSHSHNSFTWPRSQGLHASMQDEDEKQRTRSFRRIARPVPTHVAPRHEPPAEQHGLKETAAGLLSHQLLDTTPLLSQHNDLHSQSQPKQRKSVDAVSVSSATSPRQKSPFFSRTPTMRRSLSGYSAATISRSHGIANAFPDDLFATNAGKSAGLNRLSSSATNLNASLFGRQQTTPNSRNTHSGSISSSPTRQPTPRRQGSLKIVTPATLPVGILQEDAEQVTPFTRSGLSSPFKAYKRHRVDARPTAHSASLVQNLDISGTTDRTTASQHSGPPLYQMRVTPQSSSTTAHASLSLQSLGNSSPLHDSGDYSAHQAALRDEITGTSGRTDNLSPLGEEAAAHFADLVTGDAVDAQVDCCLPHAQAQVQHLLTTTSSSPPATTAATVVPATHASPEAHAPFPSASRATPPNAPAHESHPSQDEYTRFAEDELEEAFVFTSEVPASHRASLDGSYTSTSLVSTEGARVGVHGEQPDNRPTDQETHTKNINLEEDDDARAPANLGERVGQLGESDMEEINALLGVRPSQWQSIHQFASSNAYAEPSLPSAHAKPPTVPRSLSAGDTRGELVPLIGRDVDLNTSSVNAVLGVQPSQWQSLSEYIALHDFSRPSLHHPGQARRDTAQLPGSEQGTSVDVRQARSSTSATASTSNHRSSSVPPRNELSRQAVPLLRRRQHARQKEGSRRAQNVADALLSVITSASEELSLQRQQPQPGPHEKKSESQPVAAVQREALPSKAAVVAEANLRVSTREHPQLSPSQRPPHPLSKPASARTESHRGSIFFGSRPTSVTTKETASSMSSSMDEAWGVQVTQNAAFAPPKELHKPPPSKSSERQVKNAALHTTDAATSRGLHQSHDEKPLSNDAADSAEGQRPKPASAATTVDRKESSSSMVLL